MPVSKKTGDTAYSSTIVKSGEIKAVVINTGTNTKFAKTVELVQKSKHVLHFQKMVIKIGDFLIKITIALALIILIVSWIRGVPFLDTILSCLY